MIDRVLLSLPGMRRLMARCAAFSLVTGVLTALQALTLAATLTNLWNGGALPDQAALIVGFALCLVARQAAANLEARMVDDFARNTARGLRERLIDRLLAEGGGLVRDCGTGGLATTAVEGVDAVEGYVRLSAPRTVALVVVPALLLIMLVCLDWASALIALLVFPAVVLQMVLIGHTAGIQAGRQHAERQRLANHFLDSLRGIDTLKYFGRSKDESERIYRSSERFREATMKTLRTATLSGAVLDAFSTVAIAVVAVMLGFRLVDSSLALFPALAALVVMPDYFRPIREFASDYHATLDGKNALAGIMEILERPAPNPDAAALPAWGEESSLALSGVSVRHAGHAALDAVSCLFSGFRKVGVIGASGSGKTTLANLVAGLSSPDAGAFDVVGVRTPTLADASWRAQVAYLPQHPHIFHATLRDNLAFYQLDASEADVAQAASLVGLDRLVASLPDGLDTVIGEGGRTVSGGQAQRIALARVVLHRACRVLVLDEPTAHLDIETELELKERMLPVFDGKLVVFATHRLHWLSAMDDVVLLENGRVAACGAVDDVRPSEAFSRLVAQMRGGCHGN